MTIVFELIEDMSEGCVDFYTVWVGNNTICEFEHFEEKDFPNHNAELDVLYNVLYEMGERGAKLHYFKPEGAAHALPIVSTELKDANDTDYGLRLYCIRLRDDLVILLNGDIKTHIDPKQCPAVQHHFTQAVKIACSIDKAIANRDINMNNTNPFEDCEINI